MQNRLSILFECASLSLFGLFIVAPLWFRTEGMYFFFWASLFRSLQMLTIIDYARLPSRLILYVIFLFTWLLVVFGKVSNEFNIAIFIAFIIGPLGATVRFYLSDRRHPG
jgi:hypothetical protein